MSRSLPGSGSSEPLLAVRLLCTLLGGLTLLASGIRDSTRSMVGARRIEKASRTKRSDGRSLSTHISSARIGSDISYSRWPRSTPAYHSSGASFRNAKSPSHSWLLP